MAFQLRPEFALDPIVGERRVKEPVLDTWLGKLCYGNHAPLSKSIIYKTKNH